MPVMSYLNHKPALDGRGILDDDWKEVKVVSELLKLAAQLIEISSSIKNATLSLHPATIKSLISHCEEWIEKLEIPDGARKAAKLFMFKLKKYESHLFDFANLDFVLDPHSGNRGSVSA